VSSPATGPPDLVLVHGVVATLEPRRPPQEAIAIRDGRVIAASATADIERLVGSSTRVVDLAGRSVVPGLVDCHVHLATDAATRDSVDVRDLFHDIHSVEDVLARLREHASLVPPGSWLAARGSPMQAHRLLERRLPTRAELDRAVPDHPAYVTFGAHVLVANSRAVAERRVDGSTPDPDRGVVERDPATGAPTGVFLERAGVLIKGSGPSAEPEALADAIELELERCLARGVTTIHDVIADPSELRAYQALHASGRLAARVQLLARVVHSGLAGMSLADLGLGPGLGDDRLWFGGVKMSVDGGFTGGNAAFSEPAGGHARPGLIRIPQPELDDLVERYDRADTRIAVHAMGDLAVDMALGAFERRARIRPLAGARHRIEHMGNWLCSPARLRRARQLGVVPVPNPSMQSNLAREIREDLGPDRARTAFQFQAIIDAGSPLVFGSDGPGYWPINVMRDISVAASRRTRSGAAIGDPTTVSVIDALTAQTVNAAWLGFRESDLGTLGPGMRADLIVVDGDLLRADPATIGDLDVEMTIVGGQIVHERGR
jgi:predicted amidohydrolase YtcJ